MNRMERFMTDSGIDIHNAFNSVPWEVIHEVFERRSFPPYIQRTLHSYLGGRVMHLCDDNQGVLATMVVTCGVPQGSVLSPLLWNIAFDAVLRLPMPRETTVIDYAYDTLVVAEKDTIDAV